MNKVLFNVTQSLIDIRAKWLRHAIKAQVLAGFLPEAVQSLTITGIDLSDDEKELRVSIHDKEAYKTLKELGAEGFQPHYAQFVKSWYYTDGVLDLTNGHIAVFTVHEAPKPPRCRIEKREKVVTEEVAICEDSGKEL